MKTFFDYVYWRGDLNIETSPLNEVDYAIFSQLVMLNLKKVFSDFNEKLTIHDAFNRYELDENLDKNVGLIISNKSNLLLREVARVDRYKDFVITAYVNTLNEETFEQFSAFTVILNESTKLVVFSGTDDTLAGWKENLSMIHKDATEGQLKSVKYLKDASKDCEKIIVVGHSKGGNLAMYSFMNVSEAIAKKVQAVYNLDGPGFMKEITEKNLLKRAKKIIEICPESSLFGRIFNHYGTVKVVQSTFKGAFQHDVFSWILDKTEFLRAEAFSVNGDVVEEKLRNIIYSLSLEDRSRFANIVYQILDRTNTTTLTQISMNKFGLLKAYVKTPSEDKKFLKHTLGELFRDKHVRDLFLLDIFDKEASGVLKNSKKYANLEKKAKKERLKEIKKQLKD